MAYLGDVPSYVYDLLQVDPPGPPPDTVNANGDPYTLPVEVFNETTSVPAVGLLLVGSLVLLGLHHKKGKGGK